MTKIQRWPLQSYMSFGSYHINIILYLVKLMKLFILKNTKMNLKLGLFLRLINLAILATKNFKRIAPEAPLGAQERSPTKAGLKKAERKIQTQNLKQAIKKVHGPKPLLTLKEINK